MYLIAAVLAAGSLVGCAAMRGCLDRSSAAGNIARESGFTKEYVKAGDFTLMTYHRFNSLRHNSGLREGDQGSNNPESVRVYIEGDGRAWETKHRLSDDPTPSDPVALRLAAVDPADNVAYIARPGQYSLSGFPECDSKYWSGSRFAPEVIHAFTRALDLLKERSGVRYIELVGYSGGGAIAVLVAAARSDISSLRTVAGNLDPAALCVYHGVSRLDGSMDPLDAAQKVAFLPQRHFFGSKDTVVPRAIGASFVKSEGDERCERITVVEGVSHNDGWDKRWKGLLSIPLVSGYEE